MPSYLDLYLKEHGVTRYDVAQKSGLSQQMLSKANRRSPETYTVRLLEAVALTTKQEVTRVLERLLVIRDEPVLFEVSELADLKQLVKQQEDAFFVQGRLVEMIQDCRNYQLNETEEIGFQLGFSGSAGVVESALDYFYDTIVLKKEEYSRLKRKIATLYTLEEVSEGRMYLTLKMLDEKASKG